MSEHVLITNAKRDVRGAIQALDAGMPNLAKSILLLLAIELHGGSGSDVVSLKLKKCKLKVIK